jgi:uncharacterized protein
MRYILTMGASAGALLRTARLRAGLTQIELAVLAGVAQSVISAYESGKREPSFRTLSTLIEAAGFELDASLKPSPPSSPLRTRVFARRRELRNTIRSLGGSRVRLFGSVARGDDGEGSDVDLLVDVGPDVGLIQLSRMQSAAEALLEASVDIVPSSGLKPDLVESVMRDAVRL